MKAQAKKSPLVLPKLLDTQEKRAVKAQRSSGEVLSYSGEAYIKLRRVCVQSAVAWNL